MSNPPTTAGTWTTAYRYDAYDRLIASATYPGTSTSGTASMSTTYTLNTAGDIIGTTTNSSSTTNTIDAAGQLTAQTTDGTAVHQTFDADGRVTQSLNGSAITYDAFDRMLTATRGGTTATYTYWPDGTRRSTTTTSPAQPTDVCDQAIAEAGTGQGTYGRYQLIQAPAVGRSGSQVVVGTAGPDRLVGGSGDDVLCGLDGDDILEGGSGHDHLDGGAGSDELQGGSGNDVLDGGAGIDRLLGGSGNDTLTNGEDNNGGSGRNQTAPPPPVDTSTQTFHYGTDGTLVNDTTADPTTGTTATTASYLLTAGREARTLQPGTTTVGTVPAGAPAPVTTGTGTGYLLRDRHSSVTALVDATTAVTEHLLLRRLRAARLARRDTPAGTGPDAGRADQPVPVHRGVPDQLDDRPLHRSAAVTGPQLRPGPRSLHQPRHRQRLQPATKASPPTRSSTSTPPATSPSKTSSIDIGTALVFAVAAVATGGAAVAALPALVGAEVGAVTASTVVTTVATAVTAVAAATGAVASAVKAADDIDDAVTGKHFLTNDQRSALGTVQMVAGAVAAVGGLAAVRRVRSRSHRRRRHTGRHRVPRRRDDETDAADVASKRNAVVEGEDDNVGPYRLPRNVEATSDSDLEDDGVSDGSEPQMHTSPSDDVVDGITDGSEPDAHTSPSDRMGQSLLQDVVGSDEMTSTDASIFDENQAVTTSIETNEGVHPPGQSPAFGGHNQTANLFKWLDMDETETASEGVWQDEAGVHPPGQSPEFGGHNQTANLFKWLDTDDFADF